MCVCVCGACVCVCARARVVCACVVCPCASVRVCACECPYVCMYVWVYITCVGLCEVSVGTCSCFYTQKPRHEHSKRPLVFLIAIAKVLLYSLDLENQFLHSMVFGTVWSTLEPAVSPLLNCMRVDACQCTVWRTACGMYELI